MTTVADSLTNTNQGVPVRFEGVRRTFEGGVTALAGLDLAVDAGDFVAILGPSGCGKSTLLRLAAGLDRADAGRVTVGDHPAGDRAHVGEVAFVFQDAHLLPWRTVLRNVALPLELERVDKSARLAAARRVLEQVGLGDAVDRYPAQLSGGMKMRVSLARALVTSPRLLLLDEPFAALDELTRHRLDEQLRELWLARGMTVLFVTHSLQESVFLAQRAVVLSRRPARVMTDQRLDLPRHRLPEVRTSPAFTAHMARLYHALRAGSEGEPPPLEPSESPESPESPREATP